MTRKWNIVNHHSKENFDVGNEIIYNIEAWDSNLCNCNYAFILVKGDITIIAAPETHVAFKN